MLVLSISWNPRRVKTISRVFMSNEKHSKTDGDKKLAARNAGSQTTEALAENEAYTADMAQLMAALVPENFVETDIGFPPYWKPEINTGFRGVVLMRDDINPDFIR